MSEASVSDSELSTTEAVGASPGAVLRRCREFHGITLEEASDATKIAVSYLKALENDQVREFANQAYLKGFLRIYATYLGLNSDDVTRMFNKLFGVQGEKPDPTRSSAIPVRASRRLTSLKKLLFPAFLLAVILITATFFKPPPPLVRQPQPVAVVTAPPQISAVQAVLSSVRMRPPEQQLTATKAENRFAELPVPEKTVAAKYPVETAKGFILKIKVTQNGTLTATVDGSGSQPYELTIGDVIEWKAEKSVTLELSDAGGVDVELNGKPFKPLGTPGKPGYVEIGADGVKQ